MLQCLHHIFIAIFTVYKQVFCYLNFTNHRTKESFVPTTNKPLVGTLMTIGDVTVSIAIRQTNDVEENPGSTIFDIIDATSTMSAYCSFY